MSPLVGYLLLFLLVGSGFIFVHLVAGKLIRPARPGVEKSTIYECGEPTVGSAWVQFDLRYYVVALLFVIFDVEVAFFFPWAVVFGQANTLRTMDPAKYQTVGQEEREKLAKEELLGGRAPTPDADEEGQARTVDTYNHLGAQLSRLALVDILVFFGVLLVGFAYLWKRGDLAWVRSTVAPPPPPPEPERAVLEPAPDEELVASH